MPAIRSRADQAAAGALVFLRERQLPHGEFTTLVGADRDMSDPVFDSSPFFTSFIMYGLAHLDRGLAGDVIDRAAAFLRSEMELGGVWRYWTSRQHKHCRLPPDIDDTACISYALKIAGHAVPDNRWAFRCCRDSSGRFRVWISLTRRNCRTPWFLFARSAGACLARIRARNAPAPDVDDPRLQITSLDWDEVDPVVNANALLYLGECSETLAAIPYITESVLDESSGRGLWYEDRLTLYYAVARAFRHASPRLSSVGAHVVARIHERARAAEPLNAMQAAMAASALQTFEPASTLTPDLLDAVMNAQRGDGGWNAHPIYSIPGTFWGSEELTTGFCLEALARATGSPASSW